MLSSMASLTEEQVANVEPLLDNTTLQQPTSADAATSQVSATSPSPNHDSSIPPSLPTMHPVSLPVPPTGSIDPRDVVSGHHEIPSELLHIMQEIFGPSNGMEKEELQETAEETLANDDYNTSDARDYGFDFLEGDDDIEEEEEDEEEDEEQTRRALTYMLEQFGDTL
ncbi:uncharacterized protein BYT42DRAFT_317409 [Radiomyces spectabilis]|uniref:uncharacterized protein n=1 Tax=Radiomyces spectabilis TaxID=64574 RepID=UPI00221E6D1B|nr:uncharacterized protein BYT42DRAFT_317409 [Radiomyces spectabilis]KAI8379197.1 hypothetical protein BYT42DRAFT_317409 [Radiomyces spectabilis]